MARKAFYSFHYIPDNWRAGQVRGMGMIEGNQPVSDNDWETVTRGGDAAIGRWIATQMSGTSCTIVLIGNATAGRKWIDYELTKAWNDGKGLVGVHVHGLLDRHSQQTTIGSNPFTGFTVGPNKTPLQNIVRSHVPPYWRSTDVYAYIKSNLAQWVEEAITIRNQWG